MLGLAQYLVDMGHRISGSDLLESPETRLLSSRGVTFFHEHFTANVSEAELVVVSDAIPTDNVELDAARRRGVRILRRAECLNLLCAPHQAVLVAGAHGKSTTSAMIAKVLDTALTAPSFIIGANVPCLGDRRARMGIGKHFVAEACEAYRNLTYFHPDVAVITNVDSEHLEHYGSQAKLDRAFVDFANRSRPHGIVIANGDDEGVRRIRRNLAARVTTFGLERGNDVAVESYQFDRTGSRFEVSILGRMAGSIEIPMPGKHAIANALACVATCHSLGVAFDDIARGLVAFSGIPRRWEDHGLINGIQIVDDYAHHPSELRASVETARALVSDQQRLVVAFQPQLFSRMRRLYSEFAEVLVRSDHVFLLEVDPAGERNATFSSSALIGNEIRRLNGTVETFDDIDDFVDRAPRSVADGDFLLVAGAGSIRTAATLLGRRLRARTTFATASAPRRALTQPAPHGSAPPFAIGPWNALERTDTVVSLFRSHAARGASRFAVSDRSRGMTYAALDDRSDAVANTLRARGITRGFVAGVGLGRSIDLIVIVLALAKLGAVYLPLDGNLPMERVRFMISKTGCKILITWSGSKFDSAIGNIEKFYLDEPEFTETAAAVDVWDTAPGPHQENLAYICFTSGSTGHPKGVAISHRSLFGLISDITERFGITPNTRMAFNTAVGFDVSLAEMWMTLCGGGQLLVAGSSKSLFGDWLLDFVRDNRVTCLALTPSVLASLPPKPLPDLECIICAGEACSQDLVDLWARQRAFFNVYGPTEATIYATVARCQPGVKVTIGKALKHINTYVLGPNRELLGPGEAGELYLGGPGVANGYIDLGQESAKRFFALEQEGGRREWVYRTGDLVKLETDGDLSFLRRLDNQVKLRGNRIELEEVEHSIRRIIGVEAVVCVDDSMGSKQLICFVVAEAHEDIDGNAMRERLAEWLPDYMLPSHFVRIDGVPLTSNGKKDRQLLLSNARHRATVEPRSPAAAAPISLSSIWHAFRIEPSEIESALRKCSAVLDAAVTVRRDARGAPDSLVAYVEVRADADDLWLRSFLGTHLPDYLVPSAIIPVKGLPRLANGMIDVARLTQIDAASVTPTGHPVDRVLLDEVSGIFELVVGTRRAGPDDNLASLGGDSLQAVTIAVEIENRFGITVPPDVFEAAPTIYDLVRWIAAQDTGLVQSTAARRSSE